MSQSDTAFVIVDVQNDFCEGGSLAVTGGAAVASRISGYVREHAADYVTIVATRDHHVDPGDHFSAAPNYETTWPHHCVAGTAGVEFHPDLDITLVEAVFDKGHYTAAYSGFEGAAVSGESLDDWLRGRGIAHVHVAGIATDYCVKATALDAAKSGFTVTVLEDLTVGVATETTEVAVAELRRGGVTVRQAGP